jgi:hypothetical protein
MSISNRNKHKVTGAFKNIVPKAPKVFDEHGNFSHTTSHVRGNGVYHVNKGWRVQRQYNPHTLLNNLLQKIGLQSMYNV